MPKIYGTPTKGFKITCECGGFCVFGGYNACADAFRYIECMDCQKRFDMSELVHDEQAQMDQRQGRKRNENHCDA